MGELSDAFLSLPGGIGTLDELFEAWSWSQVGCSASQRLLNVAGYYDALVSFAESRHGRGLHQAQHRQCSPYRMTSGNCSTDSGGRHCRREVLDHQRAHVLQRVLSQVSRRPRRSSDQRCDFSTARRYRVALDGLHVRSRPPNSTS